MKASNETGIVKACLEFLHLKGILAWRQNTGAFTGEYKGKKRFVRFGAKGVSDILGIFTRHLGDQYDSYPVGVFLAVEVKDKTKLTADQQSFLANVKAAGGIALCVHSVTELQAALENL